MKQFRAMLHGSAAMRTYVAAILTVLCIGGYALDAKAQSTAPNDCFERAKILEGLEGGFAEKLTSVGLTKSGVLMEVLTSDKGSWTILSTQPSGYSCLVAAGENWVDVPVEAPGLSM
ncbi:MAG: hypothetical protein QF511_03740 [Rhodospirillales bacterium]|jgi:hypothetical protein|nr:hypothetical protein [Rhodospirillales bacterium]